MSKSLHELNLEQRALDRKLKEANAGNPLNALPSDVRRMVAKRLQKPARAPLQAGKKD